MGVTYHLRVYKDGYEIINNERAYVTSMTVYMFVKRLAQIYKVEMDDIGICIAGRPCNTFYQTYPGDKTHVRDLGLGRIGSYVEVFG